MNAEQFSSLVKSYVFSPGRRIVTAQSIHDVAADLGDAVLAQQALDATEFDRKVWLIQQSWEENKHIREGTRVSLRTIDQNLDRNITGIYEVAKGQVHSLEPGDEQHDICVDFLQTFFPNGAAAITRLLYEDELLAVEVLLARWQTDWSARLQQLALTPLIERTATLLVDYRAAITDIAKRATTWDDVRAMDTEGQENMLALVARILGLHNSKSEADIQLRHRYLATFFDQNERIAKIRKRTPVVPDINPDTGAELGNDTFTEANAPQQPAPEPANP